MEPRRNVDWMKSQSRLGRFYLLCIICALKVGLLMWWCVFYHLRRRTIEKRPEHNFRFFGSNISIERNNIKIIKVVGSFEMKKQNDYSIFFYLFALNMCLCWFATRQPEQTGWTNTHTLTHPNSIRTILLLLLHFIQQLIAHYPIFSFSNFTLFT